MTAIIFEWFNRGGDFEDAIADGAQAIRFISAGKEFGFDDTSPVSDSDEFHRFAGDLMKKALLDDETTGDHLLADVFTKSINGAISVPGDIREQLEWMATDGIPEEFFFSAEALKSVGFNEGNGGEAVEVAGREEPGLGIYDLRFAICDFSASCLLPLIAGISLEFPILGSARLAEDVEGTDVDERFHFFR